MDKRKSSEKQFERRLEEEEEREREGREGEEDEELTIQLPSLFSS